MTDSAPGSMRAVVVEPSGRQSVRTALVALGVAVVASVAGSDEALAAVARGADVVVVDFLLPGFAVIDVCRELRARSQVPIVVVGTGESPSDVVISLEAGADDFVREEHGPSELIARVRASIRRRESGTAAAPNAAFAKLLQVGDLTLDRRRHEMFLGEQRIHLSPKEFDLLALLLSEAGAVVHRDVLIGSVWGSDYVGDTKTLDTHIKRLRSKLEVDPAHPTRIITVRGRGFLYDASPPVTTDSEAHLLHS
jgi:two-component system, OmpR family, response regulator RegX3